MLEALTYRKCHHLLILITEEILKRKFKAEGDSLAIDEYPVQILKAFYVIL